MHFAIKVRFDTGVGFFHSWHTRDGAIQVFTTESAARYYIGRFGIVAAHVEPLGPS